ncbi:MAG: hypothetical protein R2698_02660 [Microthrixaceae bacterium]
MHSETQGRFRSTRSRVATAVLATVVTMAAVGCSSDDARPTPTTRPHPTSTTAAPRIYAIGLDPSDPTLSVEVTLIQGAAFDGPQATTESMPVDPAALTTYYHEVAASRADFDAQNKARQADPNAPVPTPRPVAAPPAQQVRVASTVVTLPSLGRLTVRRIGADLATDELIDAQAASDPNAKKTRIGDKPVLLTPDGSGGGTLTWHQAPEVTYAVTAVVDPRAPKTGSSERIMSMANDTADQIISLGR